MFFSIPQTYSIDIYGFYFEEYMLGYLHEKTRYEWIKHHKISYFTRNARNIILRGIKKKGISVKQLVMAMRSAITRGENKFPIRINRN